MPSLLPVLLACLAPSSGPLHSGRPVPLQAGLGSHLPCDSVVWTWICLAALGLLLWQTGRILRRDRQLHRADGDLQRMAAALEKANGRLREAQAQLVHAEGINILGLLAGSVAREINNPLQTILTGVRRILRYPRDAQRHQESARLMEQAVLHCRTMVQSLLDYTRMAATDSGPTDLNEVVNGALALIQHLVEEEQIDLVVRCGEAGRVECGVHELTTVVAHLVINAREALMSIPAHRVSRRPAIEVATGVFEGRATLEVRDNGPGIPAALRERVFDPSFRIEAEGPGTGLRLAIVRGVVERHGGAVEVSAGPGGGTRVSVRLPVSEGKTR